MADVNFVDVVKGNNLTPGAYLDASSLKNEDNKYGQYLASANPKDESTRQAVMNNYDPTKGNSVFMVV